MTALLVAVVATGLWGEMPRAAHDGSIYHLAYLRDGAAWYATGPPFVERQLGPGCPLFAPAIAVDRAGVAWVAWTGGDAGTWDRILIWDSATGQRRECHVRPCAPTCDVNRPTLLPLPSGGVRLVSQWGFELRTSDWPGGAERTMYGSEPVEPTYPTFDVETGDLWFSNLLACTRKDEVGVVRASGGGPECPALVPGYPAGVAAAGGHVAWIEWEEMAAFSRIRHLSPTGQLSDLEHGTIWDQEWPLVPRAAWRPGEYRVCWHDRNLLVWCASPGQAPWRVGYGRDPDVVRVGDQLATWWSRDGQLVTDRELTAPVETPTPSPPPTPTAGASPSPTPAPSPTPIDGADPPARWPAWIAALLAVLAILLSL